MSQIVIPITEDAAITDNITLFGAANIIDCINQGENHDSGTTYITPTTSGLEAEFGVVFDTAVYPSDIEKHDIVLNYAYNCNNGSGRRGRLFVYRVMSQTEALTSENLIYEFNLENDWISTGADFTTYKTDSEVLRTEAMKNIVTDDGSFIAVKILFYTTGSGNHARITSMWLSTVDADRGKSVETTNSMTIGDSTDVGQVEPLPSEIVPTGAYLGYSGFRMVVLRSNIAEQSATRTGLVTKGLLTGGNVTLNARDPLEITLNCLMKADSDDEMKSNMQNIKRVFAQGLQFMQLDRDNKFVSTEFRRGFFGILKGAIESRRVGNYNREFTLVIEVPDGFYQSEKEFECVLNILNSDDQFISPDVVLTKVGVRNIPLLFSPQVQILQAGVGGTFSYELLSSATVPFGGARVPLSIIELRAVTEAPPTTTVYTIANESRGETLIWEGNTLINDVITIDSFNERVFKTTAIGNIITDVTNGVSPGSIWPKFNPTDDLFTRSEASLGIPSVPVTKDTYNNFCSFYTDWTPNYDNSGVDLEVTIKWRRVF